MLFAVLLPVATALLCTLAGAFAPAHENSRQGVSADFSTSVWARSAPSQESDWEKGPTEPETASTFTVYYDSKRARWMSADPFDGARVGRKGGKHLSLYSYAFNSPVVLIDPDGRDPAEIRVYEARDNYSLEQLHQSGVLSWISPELEEAFQESDRQQFASEFGQKMGAVAAVMTLEAGAVNPAAFAGEAAEAVSGAMPARARPAEPATNEGRGQTYEILDGVRRSKAAELAGQKTIHAEIDVEGKTVGKAQVPIGALRSPKSVIETETPIKNKRWQDTLQQTLQGSKPPPIRVTPGTKGTPIKNVKVGGEP
jgi:RHS repeat-associated protein